MLMGQLYDGTVNFNEENIIILLLIDVELQMWIYLLKYWR